jgi:hypothetical protein
MALLRANLLIRKKLSAARARKAVAGQENLKNERRI